jgi:hypothetical protein
MNKRPDDQSEFIRSLIAGHQLTFAIPDEFAWIVEDFPGWRNETGGVGDFGAISEAAQSVNAGERDEHYELREVTLRSTIARLALFRFAGPAISDQAAATATRKAAVVALAALGHSLGEAAQPARAVAASIPYASPSDYVNGTFAWWIPHRLITGVRPRRRLSTFDLESHLRAVLKSDPALRGYSSDQIQAVFSLRHWPFDTPHSSMAISVTQGTNGEPIALSLTTAIAALSLLLAFTPLQRRLALKIAQTPIDLAPHATRTERIQPLRADPSALGNALSVLRRRNCEQLCELLTVQANAPAQTARW